ncbi:MAG: S9 family peptidase, partial [Anaerolineae bacterium]
QPLASGNDFYAAPRLRPDGSHLAWIAWNHPNMPWDRTELWVAAVGADGSLVDPHRVSGGPAESIVQPEWSPDGTLHFASDRSGWWNLYRWRSAGAEPLLEMEAEFVAPPWAFGRSTYVFLTAQRIVCAYSQGGTWTLAHLETATGSLEPVPTPFTEFWGLCTDTNRVVFGAGSPTEPPSVVELDPDTGGLEVLYRSGDVDIASEHISLPEPLEFPTEHGRRAHGLFYSPKSPDHVGASHERPPLIVMGHGGPTSSTWTTHRLDIQYWTSRGFAILDVNYGGSTGYGRAYRERLDGEWGVVDLDDCVNGARFLAGRELVDRSRMAIRGGSAGGYTTLCALAFRDVFAAGASYYGLSDLEAFTDETHKFESHYLERLVGPYPEKRDLYRERSPLHFADRISCPTIFFQGLADKIVPSDQAERMVAALRRRELPVAYVAFEGEGHGFRRAENLQRAREAELYFYSRVFGFKPSDPVEPVPIENL